MIKNDYVYVDTDSIKIQRKCILHVECPRGLDGIMAVNGTVFEIATMLKLLIAELKSQGMPEDLIMYAVANALAGEEG